MFKTLVNSTSLIANIHGEYKQHHSMITNVETSGFTDQSKVEVQTPIGVIRGVFTISYVDHVSGTIFSWDDIPEGTTAGDWLLLIKPACTHEWSDDWMPDRRVSNQPRQRCFACGDTRVKNV